MIAGGGVGRRHTAPPSNETRQIPRALARETLPGREGPHALCSRERLTGLVAVHLRWPATGFIRARWSGADMNAANFEENENHERSVSNHTDFNGSCYCL